MINKHPNFYRGPETLNVVALPSSPEAQQRPIAFGANRKDRPATEHIVDDDENLVVIYNRVPKTGSTSFINLAYDLCKKNRFHVLHINVSANNHVLSLSNQLNFVRNVTGWGEVKPALYHGHMAYLNFAK